MRSNNLSLLDIAPPELSAEEIEIRGTTLTVSGVAADSWAALYSRFPEMRLVVTGTTEGLSPVRMIAAQAALIAAGLGQLGNPEIERGVMDRLTSAEQLAVAEAIVRLSTPGHVFGPLLETPPAASATGADASPGGGPAGKDLVTK